MSALFAGLRLCQPPMHTNINEISQTIIGAAIEVHRTLGPGLLESAYEQCLSHEFSLRQIAVERQKPLHIDYKGVALDCGYRLDFLVSGMVVVEVKAIEALLPIHQAQLLSYLKLGGWKLGLLINFHAPLLRQGIKRVVLGLEEAPNSIAKRSIL
jgi:GxxExxY protein